MDAEHGVVLHANPDVADGSHRGELRGTIAARRLTAETVARRPSRAPLMMLLNVDDERRYRCSAAHGHGWPLLNVCRWLYRVWRRYYCC